MSVEALIEFLDNAEEVGKNEATTDGAIAVANVKLHTSELPKIPTEFATLLKKYNGLSCDGNTIFGVNTGTMFFPDLVEFNLNWFEHQPSPFLALGQDEEFLLIYDGEEKNYHLVYKSDFEEYLTSDDLFETVALILKI